ncbi:MAG TPA: WhiB family transcriptional regulator [Acidimicrobiales bacterium]|nr:WhiB family transcriptional regulator [Acidimicrobiales bacterium]
MPWSPVSDWDKKGWREQAACRDADAKLFFTIGTTGIAANQIAAAKAICGRCPVREACLQFAFETNQEAGVWGGTDEDERRRLRRAWRTGRRARPRSASR